MTRMIYQKKLPTPKQLIKDVPINEKDAKIKEERDKEIHAILDGKSDKFILVIGPCSADDPKAVEEYVKRLSKIQEEVKDKLIFIPRIYTNKPRTNGLGYKGASTQPDPKKESDLLEGLKVMRQMHVTALKYGFSTADEMLNPQNHPFLGDILSYVAVGARSVENQQHRLVASGVDVPVGMKNPTGGDLSVMFNAIIAAQASHHFSYNLWDVKTTGNNHAHAVLRGYVDDKGNNFPNYDFETLKKVSEKYIELKLANPSIIVDTNHSNSGKKYDKQPEIAMDVLKSMKKSPLIRKTVKGLMIESYLEDGTQKVGEDVFGKSITDPCLGWEKTQKLIKMIYNEYGKLDN